MSKGCAVRMASVGVVISAVLCAGCTSVPRDLTPRSPQMSAVELRQYYDYPRKPIEAIVRQKESSKRWTRFRVEHELVWPEDLDTAPIQRARAIVANASSGSRRVRNAALEFTNRLDYFRPNSPGKHPLVVLSPPMGGSTVLVEDFAKYFAAHGFCAVVVHRKRSVVREDEGLEQVERYLRLSVLRVRQSLDWALLQPEVEADKVASFGVSYGSIINTSGIL